PHMDFGAGRSLDASRIRSTVDGTISTEGESVLHAGDSRITGQAFVIQNGDIITFDSDKRTTLTANGRETRGDKTHARFDSRGNQLIELVQTGHFSFNDAQRHGSSNNASFSDGFAVATLEGA